MSLCAKVPPYLPDFEIIPLALVASIHFWGERVKAFSPASFLNLSNSIGLKFGLYKVSQIFNGIAVSHPVANNYKGVGGLKFCYIGQRNIIVFVNLQNSYICLFYIYFCHSILLSGDNLSLCYFLLIIFYFKTKQPASVIFVLARTRLELCLELRKFIENRDYFLLNWEGWNGDFKV